MKHQAIVVGCGISGLTTAISLQRAGWEVEIVTAAMPAETTSAVAAAIWYPHLAFPRDKILEWGRWAYEVLTAHAGEPDSGVIMRAGVEVFRASEPDPWWQRAVPGVERAPAADLPDGYRSGLSFTVPVVETPVYLDWLLGRFRGAGGAVRVQEISDLRTLIGQGTDGGHAVANCTGLAARDLLDDDELVPVRGQVVRIANPGIERFVLDQHHADGPTYVIPRSSDCVLGGTTDEGVWDTTPDDQVAAGILERCAGLDPRVADAEVVDTYCGLRPARSTVRVEVEDRDGHLLAHNYGHGGAGVTLSWGCAEAVVATLAGTSGNQ